MIDLGIGIYKISMSGFPRPRILYVGQSKYLYDRLKTHRYQLRANKHHNPHLQNVYNKHGGTGMVYEILETCRLEELNEREQYYIDALRPECNIVLDVKNMHVRREEKPEPAMMSIEIPGLELDWQPLPWHKIVYGSGRGGV